MVYLIIALTLVFLVVLAYLLRLRLVIDLQISRESKYLSLILKLSGIKVSKYSLTFNRYGKGLYTLNYFKNDKLVNTYELKDLFEKKEKKKKVISARDIIDTLDMFLDKQRLVIGKIELDLELGLEDAAATALLSGMVISLVNAALARIYASQGIPKYTTIHVKPYFGRLQFRLVLQCILSIRLAYIIMAGIRISLSLLRKKVSAIASDRKHTQDDNG